MKAYREIWKTHRRRESIIYVAKHGCREAVEKHVPVPDTEEGAIKLTKGMTKPRFK